MKELGDIEATLDLRLVICCDPEGDTSAVGLLVELIDTSIEPERRKYIFFWTWDSSQR